MLLRFLGCIFAIGCVTGCNGPGRAPGRFPVGVATVPLSTDPNKPPLITEVWYPAPDATVEMSQVYAGGYRGRAVRDAPLRDTGRYPLVLLSHGLRGGRYDLSWVAEALAAEGIIAAAVEHPGSDEATFDEKEASKLWIRAQTLSRVLDGMLQSVRFGHFIEPGHVAAVGHSLGGSTVLVLAGARLNAERFAAYFPGSAPADIGSWYDPRVRGVAALAPGTGPGFAPDGIAQVQVPALLYSGTADWLTPEPTNAGYFAKYIPNVQWHSLAHVGHYTFEPECTWYGKLRVRALCVDRWQVRRHLVHAEAIEGIRAFLARVWAD